VAKTKVTNFFRIRDAIDGKKEIELEMANPTLIPTIIARKRQRNMKTFTVVHWSMASPWTGYLKSAHAAHGLGGEALAGQAFQRHATDSCHVT